MSSSYELGDLTLSTDVTPADWIVHGVRDFKHDVASLIPQGFAAYARLFHPAYKYAAGQEIRVRWSEVAKAHGRTSHPAMEWVALTGHWQSQFSDDADEVWNIGPAVGSLPAEDAAHLSEILTGFTGTADRCWFAVWEGYSALAVPLEGTPRVRFPHRPMVLLGGPITAASTSLESEPFDQRASLWWPDDDAWCVATDVGLTSTFIGGSRECIDAILADDRLEALEVTAQQKITWESDLLNPPPADDFG